MLLSCPFGVERLFYLPHPFYFLFFYLLFWGPPASRITYISICNQLQKRWWPLQLYTDFSLKEGSSECRHFFLQKMQFFHHRTTISWRHFTPQWLQSMDFLFHIMINANVSHKTCIRTLTINPSLAALKILRNNVNIELSDILSQYWMF